jgi:phage tail tube protein FII
MSDREQAYKGLSMTVMGFGFLGSLTAFEPPEVKEMTESYRGGRAAPMKMMVGYEEVESKFKLSRDDANVAALRAIVGRDVVMTIRASADEKGKTIETHWAVYGRIYSVETAEVKAGAIVDKTYSVTVEKFLKSIDGIPVEGFDIATGELKFGSTDILADVKAQIGL